MIADALVSRHTAGRQAATVHPFLVGVRDGSVPEDSFDRWLVQDYQYAQALVRAQSRIAAAAPFADVGLLAGGAVLRRWRRGAAWSSTPPCIRRLGPMRLPAGIDLLRRGHCPR